MRHYRHLTLYEREKLLFLRAKGYSITAIAESIGRNKGTISRELRRNSIGRQYMPVVAQHQYRARRAYCTPHNRLDCTSLLEHVKHRLLECQWSPEEIAGRLQVEYDQCIISTTTIYRAIYNGWLNAPKATAASVIKKLGTVANVGKSIQLRRSVAKSSLAMILQNARQEPKTVLK